MNRSSFKRFSIWMICLGLFASAAISKAITVDELINQKDITPEGVAKVVSDFGFELRPQLQLPDTFLKNHNGDCADYANLASTVLGRHGYTTKMIVVMMRKQTHVVCYIKEAGGFLDYNHRADAHPVIPSDGSIEDIASKVSKDFASDWNMASVFRYEGVSPVFLDNVFAPEKPVAKTQAHRIAKARASGRKDSASVANSSAATASTDPAPLAMQSTIN